MTRRLALNVFVDACGWDVVAPRPWFLPELHHRQSVESIFGYSSACVPAILGGRRPDENDHFCFLRWDPDRSPFRDASKWLARLPRPISDRARVRRWLSARLARELGIDGYFSLYDLPLDRLKEFDWTERRDLFAPGGLNRGRSIFDSLLARRIPYHVSDWRIPEAHRFGRAAEVIDRGEVEFVFVYSADLDGLLHRHGHAPEIVDRKLRELMQRVRALTRIARRRYDEVDVTLFSDHGMAEVAEVRNLRSEIDALGLSWGRDYAAIYDSTMARFWFLSGRAEERIRNALVDDRRGRWLSEARQRALGVHWADARYGHAFYSLEPGQLLSPSHLGRGRLAGMHGYRLDHEDSFATLLSSRTPRVRVESLTDLHDMMQAGSRWSSATHEAA